MVFSSSVSSRYVTLHTSHTSSMNATSIKSRKPKPRKEIRSSIDIRIEISSVPKESGVCWFDGYLDNNRIYAHVVTKVIKDAGVIVRYQEKQYSLSHFRGSFYYFSY